VAVEAETEMQTPSSNEGSAGVKKLKVVIAGGGIGGLALALACQNKGMDVKVIEKVRKYKPFGGPIQLQCNAMGTMEAIDIDLANQIYQNCSVTGDRINGLMDGRKGFWFFRFDTRQPCYRSGLPLTLVIYRAKLLELLVNKVGAENIVSGGNVVSFSENDTGVTALLEDGSSVHGDVLVGADGIRSTVRKAMHPEERSPLAYSGYTVYTGTCDFTAIHTDPTKVGYQVYLGHKKYFVASDVGAGTQQWYAFHQEPAGGEDARDKKEVLTDYFKDWNPAMRERLECTKPEVIERRDIYDLIPAVNPGKWTRGRVALLGDAIHAVQPNLGQGGGQAIESAYTLAAQLEKLQPGSSTKQVQSALREYANLRVIRAASVHGLSRMLGLLNIVYRPNLGDQPYSVYPEGVRKFWAAVSQFNIPHPGRILGQILMMGSMQYILEYVGSGLDLPQAIGGSPVKEANLKGERQLTCAVPGIGSPKRPLEDDDFKMKGVPGFGK